MYEYISSTGGRDMNELDSKIIHLIQSRDEQGIQLLLKQYGGLIQSICKKNLYHLDSHLDECINDCLFGIWNNIGNPKYNFNFSK